MFSRVRIAIRFFFLGLAVGVLLAPRSGEATRRMLRDRADRLLNDVLDAASLGASSGAADEPPVEEATAPRPAGRSNGSGTGSRSRKSSSSGTGSTSGTSGTSGSEAEATAGA